jgi:hypothetical protein
LTSKHSLSFGIFPHFSPLQPKIIENLSESQEKLKIFFTKFILHGLAKNPEINPS